MGAFEQLFGPVRGDLKKFFQKFKCLGGFPGEGGGGLKLRFDWYMSETFVYLAIVLCVHYDICRFMLQLVLYLVA